MRSSLTISLVVSQFLLCTVCFAQDDNLDSLKKTLSTLHDTARIPCIVKIWVHYMHNPNKDSAVFYSNLCYEESKKFNSTNGIAQSFTMKARIARKFDRDFRRAETIIHEAINWFNHSTDKTNIEYAYEEAAISLFDQYKYDEAGPYLDRWYYWAEKNGNRDALQSKLGFEYEGYRDIGEYDKAFEAFQKNQQLNQRFDGKKSELYENYVLAELQRRMGNYPVALTYYHKVIAAFKDLGSENIWFRISYPELFAMNGQFDSARYYYNLIDSSKLNEHDRRFYLVSIGEFYLLQKKYDEALSPLLRGLQDHREAGDTNDVKRALIGIAKAYAGLGQDASALFYTRHALDLSIRSHAKQYIMEGYQILYEIYQRRNQSDSAFKYYQKYVTQKEIVANDVVKGKFAAYDYQQQIALLDKDQIVQKQKLQKEKTRRNILIGAFAIALLLGAFSIRNIQLKRKKDKLQHLMTEANTQLENRKKEQQLAEIQQQKTELEMQALRAQMNPHFIFNSLNSINMFILENNKLRASEYLSKFSRLVRLILQNSQEAFIPLERELEALQLYLELESLRFDNKFDYKISVDNQIDTTVLKVPPLIIQPYVENAIWHGLMHKKDKGHLDIALYPEEKILFCKITDDGIGRNKATELASKNPQGHKSTGMRITADRIAVNQQNKQADMHVTIRDLMMSDGSAGGTEVLFAIPAIE